MFKDVCEAITQIRKVKPLILNITNHVSIGFIADGLLSLGASPIMCFSKKEVEALMHLSNAVVINIGTLNDEFIDLCHHVCKFAQKMNKKIILDPVGAGASEYRTKTCLDLLENYKISVLCGNASEIAALVNNNIITKGVDSALASTQCIEEAKIISTAYNLLVAMSGESDFIVDNEKVYRLKRGSSIMPLVTGTGCLLTAIIGAFCAVDDEHFKATVHATLFYNVCAEIAATDTQYPGSFKIQFIDALNSTPEKEHYDQ